MANDSEVVDQLAKLRLKLIEQKIDVERQKSAQRHHLSGRVSGHGAEGGSYSDSRHALQAEIFKSQQLLEQVQEERYLLKHKHQLQESRQASSNHNDQNNLNTEILSVVLSQNVQLQQMMFKQMQTTPTSKEVENTPRPVEIEQVSYREMTPFTLLPQNNPIDKGVPPKPLLPRKASPLRAPRIAATPVRSTELIREPRPKTKTPPASGFLNKPLSHDAIDGPYPFPGTKGIRKLRHVFLATWFCFILISTLKKVIKRRLEAIERLDECINTSIIELHEQYYLNQDNPIWTALYDLVKEGCLSAKVNSPGIFQKLSPGDQASLTELSSIVETVVYSITVIKPSSGLLSPSRDGVLLYMLQPDVYLPPTYLWEVEKDKLQFTEKGSISLQDKATGILLVNSLFISRGLVSSILLKPLESGLSPHEPSTVAQSNLKVLASILMKIVREVSVLPKAKAMPIASEISSHLYSDDEMKFIFKKLDGTLIWSKANLSKWASGFVDMVNSS